MLTLGVLAALAAAIGPATIGQARAGPIVLTDAFGRTVTLPGPARRIVTIFASNTEMVAALGLADRIVGIEAYTRFPPEVLDRPLVGGRLGFSVDAVVARDPDLVVVTPSRQAAHQLVDPMERIGVPVLVLMQRTVAEVMANIRLLGRAAGVPAAGEAVAARLEARISRVTDRLNDRPRPRVIMITGRLGNGLVLVARPNTYTADAVALAGGRFGLDQSPTLSQVSPEAVLRADPDVLLFAGRAEDLAELSARAGWRDMRAVRTGRAFTVPRAEFLIPGPRTVDGIERLAAVLHPDPAR
ncbi:ABC transporter substrate-binding protein [Rhodoplanes sp. TEM]|uniref:ABC transporter substrate-binding protein n=1 Tax=Rhodoplanes tepidamans TaxID=200616 RepID=A0ABT5JA06_RHOTP|nr:MULTISPECIES: ABC transporter substrate-binding protein [Rhodoplanes]MDC7785885.1 ABC transporter substrate-binding protein [Rhodoplanes tepidamans]MDC7984997.1 ABC transporter substrate-binding protein [Rhodoplanes sp. TEM]MDQ0355497.1 iron complex transport system substrate-binding protein [Rhodoplanes tepidamans]